MFEKKNLIKNKKRICLQASEWMSQEQGYGFFLIFNACVMLHL